AEAVTSAVFVRTESELLCSFLFSSFFFSSFLFGTLFDSFLFGSFLGGLFLAHLVHSLFSCRLLGSFACCRLVGGGLSFGGAAATGDCENHGKRRCDCDCLHCSVLLRVHQLMVDQIWSTV